MERIPELEVIQEQADARRFNEVMGKGPVQNEYRRLARDVISMLPQGGKILDVGCGSGFVTIEISYLLRDKAQVIGLDLSDAMLGLAAENAHARGVSNFVSWRVGDAKRMPFDTDEFDFVVSSGSLHHWEAPQVVFDEIARVLNPDGQCLVRDSKRLMRRRERFLAWLIGLSLPTDFHKHYWGSIHSSYTSDELHQILQSSQLQGWQITEDVMDIMVRKGKSYV